jgi:hypothetical protein
VAQETQASGLTLDLAVQVTQALELTLALVATDTQVPAQDLEALAVFLVASASAARLELAETQAWALVSEVMAREALEPTLAVTAREVLEPASEAALHLPSEPTSEVTARAV